MSAHSVLGRFYGSSTSFGRYEIIPARMLRPEDRVRQVASHLVVWDLEHWLHDSDSPVNLHALHEAVHAHLMPTGVSTLEHDHYKHRVLKDLEAALRDGRLVALKVARPGPGGTPIRVPEAGTRKPVEEQQKGWVEIVLRDEDGVPYSHKEVRIELPDGSTREIAPDANGAVRLEGITEGPCKLQLPSLDAASWKHA